MSNSLRYNFFRIEKEYTVTDEDTKNLRKFMTPILGPTPIVLYEYLKDLISGSHEYDSNFEFETLALYLRISVEELHNARRQLEAVGLLTTTESQKHSRNVFYLEKPLDAFALEKNEIISTFIKNQISKANYDRLLEEQKLLRKSQKYAYADVSANFYDVFDNDDQEEDQNYINFFAQQSNKERTQEQKQSMLKDVAVQQRLIFGEVKFDNDYEAALNLNPVSFYMQLLNKDNIELEIEAKLHSLESKISDYKIINVALLLSYLSTKRISLTLVSRLMKELIDLKITDFIYAEAYLDNKFMQSKHAHAYEKKNLLKLTYEDQQNAKSKEISYEQIWD
ncbi:hypothetical protein [Mycoplasma sp. Ms02]|uniref:hypothetical protein n=1 Tax=Mycoplasma sp. Ms02 TaxID=353851 RepID=UPI001C8ADC0A|nr:hypothetical protein [Mycoplasma sp. Ms02]QZE12340.1 hypothetical protein K4L35_03335 [Mycoplasma sp. Ms02]